MRSRGRSGRDRHLSAVVVLGLSLGTGGCAGEHATFRIEPEPSDRGSIHVTTSDWSAETTTFSGSVWLGFGPGYASTVDTHIQLLQQPTSALPQGCFPYNGAVSFQSVEVDGPIDALPIERGLSLSPRGPGRGRIVAHGLFRDDTPPESCPFLAGDEVAMTVEMDFTVTDAPQVGWFRAPSFGSTADGGLVEGPPCGDGVDVVPAMARAQLRGIEPTAIDDTGEPVHLINATESGQVALTLRGLDGSELEPKTRFQSVTVPPEGRFDVVPDHGQAITVEAVPPRRIDDAKIVFGLYSGHELEPGEVNELPPSASRKLGVAVTSVFREGVELCSYPRPTDFALRATTPETCVLGARNDRPVFKGLGSVLDDWVELKASGECALEIGITVGSYRQSVGFTALGVEALE